MEAGKSCATVESGKWVGPAKAAFGAAVVTVNEALAAKPALANEDPYGSGLAGHPQARRLGRAPRAR